MNQINDTFTSGFINKNNYIMKRKDYEKPAMRVVLIQQHAQLLAGSVEASRNSYGTANDGLTDGINSDGEWEWN